MYQQEVLRLQGKMAASQFHTVIIDKDNRAFGFGQSANGALGLATEGDDMLDTSAVAPSRLAFKNTELKKLMDDESKPKDVRVGCTDDGTVLLVDGLVFQLGRQRPIGATEAYEPGPMEQKLDFKTQGRYASKKNQLIKAVACGNSFSVAIAQDVPDLFVWGRPAFSEKLFQIEKGAEISVPRPFKINDAKSPIIQLACGTHHTLALDRDGNIWSFGTNKYGQLGLPGVAHSDSPTKITKCTNDTGDRPLFAMVCAGWGHSMALDQEGKVYSWGSNKYGTLGLGKQVKDVPKPTMIKLQAKALSISCSTYHSLAVGKTNTTSSLYIWGRANYGRLGLGTDTTQNIFEPTPVYLHTSGVEYAVCAVYHTVAVDGQGRGWTWGWNEGWRTGQRSEADEKLDAPPDGITSNPKQIERFFHKDAHLTENEDPNFVPPNLPDVAPDLNQEHFKAVSIACGEAHTCVVSDKKKVVTWGSNTVGQLGRGEEGLGFSGLPDSIAVLHHVSKIACGANHSLAIMNYMVFSWGSNDYGQLGNNNFKPERTPQPVQALQGRNIHFIFAGWNSSCALYVPQSRKTNQKGESDFASTASPSDEEEGKTRASVFMWGDHRSGQLGIGNKNPKKGFHPGGETSDELWAQKTPVWLQKGIPPDLKIQQVCFGREHCLILGYIRKDDEDVTELYVCGRNTYGQLGLGKENMGSSKIFSRPVQVRNWLPLETTENPMAPEGSREGSFTRSFTAMSGKSEDFRQREERGVCRTWGEFLFGNGSPDPSPDKAKRRMDVGFKSDFARVPARPAESLTDDGDPISAEDFRNGHSGPDVGKPTISLIEAGADTSYAIVEQGGQSDVVYGWGRIQNTLLDREEKTDPAEEEEEQDDRGNIFDKIKRTFTSDDEEGREVGAPEYFRSLSVPHHLLSLTPDSQQTRFKVRQIKAGQGSHVLMLVSVGSTAGDKQHKREVWSWGMDTDGQTGRKLDGPTTPFAPFFPKRIKFQDFDDQKYRISKICCGNSHSVAVTEQGMLIAWGNGQLGRLGRGHDSFGNFATMSTHLAQYVRRFEKSRQPQNLIDQYALLKRSMARIGRPGSPLGVMPFSPEAGLGDPNFNAAAVNLSLLPESQQGALDVLKKCGLFDMEGHPIYGRVSWKEKQVLQTLSALGDELKKDGELLEKKNRQKLAKSVASYEKQLRQKSRYQTLIDRATHSRLANDRALEPARKRSSRIMMLRHFPPSLTESDSLMPRAVNTLTSLEKTLAKLRMHPCELLDVFTEWNTSSDSQENAAADRAPHVRHTVSMLKSFRQSQRNNARPAYCKTCDVDVQGGAIGFSRHLTTPSHEANLHRIRNRDFCELLFAIYNPERPDGTRQLLKFLELMLNPQRVDASSSRLAENSLEWFVLRESFCRGRQGRCLAEALWAAVEEEEEVKGEDEDMLDGERGVYVAESSKASAPKSIASSMLDNPSFQHASKDILTALEDFKLSEGTRAGLRRRLHDGYIFLRDMAVRVFECWMAGSDMFSTNNDTTSFPPRKLASPKAQQRFLRIMAASRELCDLAFHCMYNKRLGADGAPDHAKEEFLGQVLLTCMCDCFEAFAKERYLERLKVKRQQVATELAALQTPSLKLPDTYQAILLSLHYLRGLVSADSVAKTGQTEEWSCRLKQRLMDVYNLKETDIINKNVPAYQLTDPKVLVSKLDYLWAYLNLRRQNFSAMSLHRKLELEHASFEDFVALRSEKLDDRIVLPVSVFDRFRKIFQDGERKTRGHEELEGVSLRTLNARLVVRLDCFWAFYGQPWVKCEKCSVWHVDDPEDFLDEKEAYNLSNLAKKPTTGENKVLITDEEARILQTQFDKLQAKGELPDLTNQESWNNSIHALHERTRELTNPEQSWDVYQLEVALGVLSKIRSARKSALSQIFIGDSTENIKDSIDFPVVRLATKVKQYLEEKESAHLQVFRRVKSIAFANQVVMYLAEDAQKENKRLRVQFEDIVKGRTRNHREDVLGPFKEGETRSKSLKMMGEGFRKYPKSKNETCLASGAFAQYSYHDMVKRGIILRLGERESMEDVDTDWKDPTLLRSCGCIHCCACYYSCCLFFPCVRPCITPELKQTQRFLRRLFFLIQANIHNPDSIYFALIYRQPLGRWRRVGRWKRMWARHSEGNLLQTVLDDNEREGKTALQHEITKQVLKLHQEEPYITITYDALGDDVPISDIVTFYIDKQKLLEEIEVLTRHVAKVS